MINRQDKIAEKIIKAWNIQAGNDGPKPKFEKGDTVKTYGGYTEIWSVGAYDDYVKDRRYVVMNPDTHQKLNMFEKNIKKASVSDRVSQNVRASLNIKADNDPRPPRMKKPIVTPAAHRVYKLYIQDLLQDILVDKYGTKRGTENWEYFVDKGGGAYFAVGQAIQDEKAQMYLDLGERPPSNYFAESYYNVWKRWMTRSITARSFVSMVRHLKCVSTGRLEVVEGEASSAEAKVGDVFTVRQEDRFRYYGTLNTHGSMFQHNTGLSGNPINSVFTNPSGIEMAVQKDKIDIDRDNFWATWRII